MNEINLEKDIIILSNQTISKLFSYENGAEVVALYLFYHKQCKLQGTNQSFTVSEFAKKGLKWGDTKFKKAKTVLRDLGLIEDVKDIGKDGKIKGWYVKLNYIKTTHPENQGVVSPGGGFQKTNAGSYKKEMLKVNKENTKKLQKDSETLYKSFVDNFSKDKKQYFRKAQSIIYLERLLKEFSFDQLDNSIKVYKQKTESKYWMSPQYFFSDTKNVNAKHYRPFLDYMNEEVPNKEERLKQMKSIFFND